MVFGDPGNHGAPVPSLVEMEYSPELELVTILHQIVLANLALATTQNFDRAMRKYVIVSILWF